MGVSKTTIVNYHNRYALDIIKPNRSVQEIALEKWLIDINIEFTTNTTKIISPLSLDFYMPSKNIAIEIQGDYWHMNPKIYVANDTNRKLKTAQEIWDKDALKVRKCEDKGIKLITIWESDWKNNKEQIKKDLLIILK